MIATLLRIFFIHLRRDRVVWLLTFIVPVAFFSIFAIIFSGASGRGSTPAVRVAVVDEDGSDFSKKLMATLEKEKGLRVTTAADSGDPLIRKDAETLVRNGKVSAALILPTGLGQSFGRFGGDRPTVEVLADTSDPVAPQMLSGMLQGLALTAAPDAMIRGGIDQFKKWGGPLTPAQQKALDQAGQFLNPPTDDKANGNAAGSGLLAVNVVDVLGEAKANPVSPSTRQRRR